MSDYPKPHIDGDWHPSISEDYENARDDDERRHILLSAGYDKAHESEVKRLFDEPLELENRKKHEKKKAVMKKLKKGFSAFPKVCGAIITIVGVVEAILFLFSII